MRISAFLQEVLEGFRLLNLKNDSLRKKFDSIKYDMKKVEEVVYDLSIRGLVKPQASEDATTSVEKSLSEVTVKDSNWFEWSTLKKVKFYRFFNFVYLANDKEE